MFEGFYLFSVTTWMQWVDLSSLPTRFGMSATSTPPASAAEQAVLLTREDKPASPAKDEASSSSSSNEISASGSAPALPAAGFSFTFYLVRAPLQLVTVIATTVAGMMQMMIAIPAHLFAGGSARPKVDLETVRRMPVRPSRIPKWRGRRMIVDEEAAEGLWEEEEEEEDEDEEKERGDGETSDEQDGMIEIRIDMETSETQASEDEEPVRDFARVGTIEANLVPVSMDIYDDEPPVPETLPMVITISMTSVPPSPIPTATIVLTDPTPLSSEIRGEEPTAYESPRVIMEAATPVQEIHNYEADIFEIQSPAYEIPVVTIMANNTTPLILEICDNEPPACETLTTDFAPLASETRDDKAAGLQMLETCDDELFACETSNTAQLISEAHIDEPLACEIEPELPSKEEPAAYEILTEAMIPNDSTSEIRKDEPVTCESPVEAIILSDFVLLTPETRDELSVDEAPSTPETSNDNAITCERPTAVVITAEPARQRKSSLSPPATLIPRHPSYHRRNSDTSTVSSDSSTSSPRQLKSRASFTTASRPRPTTPSPRSTTPSPRSTTPSPSPSPRPSLTTTSTRFRTSSSPSPRPTATISNRARPTTPSASPRPIATTSTRSRTPSAPSPRPFITTSTPRRPLTPSFSPQPKSLATSPRRPTTPSSPSAQPGPAPSTSTPAWSRSTRRSVMPATTPQDGPPPVGTAVAPHLVLESSRSVSRRASLNNLAILAKAEARPKVKTMGELLYDNPMLRTIENDIEPWKL